MVLSERSSLGLSEYTLFQINKINIFIYKNTILGKKLKVLGFFFAVFFSNYFQCLAII